MAYQSEYALENEVLQQLEGLGYERVSIHNVEQLHANFRAIINERHKDKLNGKPLTDREFERLMTGINGKSVLIARCSYAIVTCLNEMMILIYTSIF